MPVLAGAVSAGVATAVGAWRYNRANYMFDSNMRFGRYTTGYSVAITQTMMYRDDIRDLTLLTVTKQDTYHVVGVIFFVVNFQLIMAGRLGMGGAAPPGWLLGLYWGNISSALMFLIVCTWLSMHASARATAGGAHMLTRSVRLPIPTPRQLDKARRTGNSFERQRMTDVFRVPFIAPAPKDPMAEEDSEVGHKAGPAKRRIPKWHHDENQELHAGSGAAPAPGALPEHFELYRGLQQEWWGHDVYSRIGLLYFITHWLVGVTLYTQCYTVAEQRQVWPAWMVTLVFSAVHHAVLRCDIVVPDRCGRWWDIPVEKLLPAMPLIAALGVTVEYSILGPSSGWRAFIYLLSWICYGLQLAWALRLYELAQPCEQAERPETPGQPWWPSEWWLPVAFQNAVYLVAPPKHLEPGQSCLLQEMKAGKDTKPQVVAQQKAKEAGPMLLPWKVFRGAILTTISMWVFIMFARLFEQANGERQLLRQEGRMERPPASVQPWMAPWSRSGSRNEWGHAGGSDRRLSAARGREVEDVARQLLTVLGPLADALDGPRRGAGLAAARAGGPPGVSRPSA